MHSPSTFIRTFSRLRHTFSHQPVPQHLDHFARSCAPYLELARVHKPAGVIAIYTPYLLGVLVATTSSQPAPRRPWPASITLHLAVLLAAFLLRSAGCAWNDVADRAIDRRVARSRHRPIARGAISAAQGGIFAAVLAVAWLAVVARVCARALLFGIANLPLVLVYPYAKRGTDFPQLVLGVTLAWGVGTGYVMAQGGVDAASGLGMPAATEVKVALGALATAWGCFTVFYDTIYAYQDVEDDRQVGVRSTAVRFEDKGRLALRLAVLCQVILELIAGRALRWNALQLWSCVGTAVVQLYIVGSVELRDPQSCASWFKKSLLIVSVLMVMSVTFGTKW